MIICWGFLLRSAPDHCQHPHHLPNLFGKSFFVEYSLWIFNNFFCFDLTWRIPKHKRMFPYPWATLWLYCHCKVGQDGALSLFFWGRGCSWFWLWFGVHQRNGEAVASAIRSHQNTSIYLVIILSLLFSHIGAAYTLEMDKVYVCQLQYNYFLYVLIRR